jgi:hypothetical protein
MSESHIKLGESFFFGVSNEYTSGNMKDFAIDGHPGAFADFETLQEYCTREVLTYGGKTVIFKCEPVLTVDLDYARAFAQLMGMDVTEGWTIDETDGPEDA